MLSVSVRVTARWHVTEPEYYEYQGVITLQFNGTLKSDAAGSPSVSKGNRVFQPVLTYQPEVMTLSYTYNEQKTTLRPIPDGMCQDPLIFEYQDSGVSSISGGAGFKIQRFTAMAAPYLQNLSADKQQFFSAMQGSMAVPDYYEFFVGGPGRKKRLQGRKKDDTKEACEYIPVDKNLCGCQVGIQMKLPVSGGMAGTRTWSADDQGLCPPSLGIHVSDIAPILKKTPFKPPEGGNKNVTYTVSWQIGRAVNFPGEEDSADESPDKDCRNMRKRANFIRIVMAAYGNHAVRDAIKNMAVDEQYKKALYQATIEKIAMDAAGDQNLPNIWEKVDQAANATGSVVAEVDNMLAEEASILPEQPVTRDEPLCPGDTLKTKSAQTWLKAATVVNFDGQIVGAKIVGYVDGKPVTLEMYDMNGNVIASNDSADIQKEWEANHGEMAGRSMFKNSLAHERTHVKQYIRSKRVSKNVDEMGDRELEAYQKELDGLLEDINNDC